MGAGPACAELEMFDGLDPEGLRRGPAARSGALLFTSNGNLRVRRLHEPRSSVPGASRLRAAEVALSGVAGGRLGQSLVSRWEGARVARQDDALGPRDLDAVLLERG
jgi:hypothetical protein